MEYEPANDRSQQSKACCEQEWYSDPEFTSNSTGDRPEDDARCTGSGNPAKP